MNIGRDIKGPGRAGAHCSKLLTYDALHSYCVFTCPPRSWHCPGPCRSHSRPHSSLTKRNCTFDSIAVLIVVCQLLSAHCRVRIPEHLLLHTRSKRRLRAHLGQVLRRVLLADNVQRVRTVLGNVCRLLYVGFLIFCVSAVTDGVVVTCIPQGEAA
jgi:hypothetical protein